MSSPSRNPFAKVKPAPGGRYPPSIQQLIRSLSEAREVAKTATGTDLDTAEAECRHLELQWRRYCLKVSPTGLCPPEILSVIFWLYLIENPRRVRRLLLVCKQWHDITINDPRLWNRISIRLPQNTMYLATAAESYKKHAQVCLQRVTAVLLHIELDCKELSWTYGQAEVAIRESIAFNMDSDKELSPDQIAMEMNMTDISRTKANCLTLPTLGTVQLLAGQSGENMSRWGSLELTLPPPDFEDTAERLWRLFKGPTPQLIRLKISSYWSGSGIAYSSDLVGSFPDLQGLKHLDIDNIRIFQSLTLHPSSVESLVIHDGFVFWSAYNLSQFSHLQYLEISSIDQDNPNETVKVCLPLLRQLDLPDIVRHISEIEFHTPILQDINLLSSPNYEGFISDLKDSLPGIQSLHVHWGWRKLHLRQPSLGERLLKEMKTLTVHFDKAKQLTVPEWARNALIETVQHLHQCGELSHDLETIRFEDEEGRVETMKVEAALFNPSP